MQLLSLSCPVFQVGVVWLQFATVLSQSKYNFCGEGNNFNIKRLQYNTKKTYITTKTGGCYKLNFIMKTKSDIFLIVPHPKLNLI